MQHKLLWDTMAREAAAESDLWAAALLPSDERQLVAVFSPLAPDGFALGLETIYEGYLMHYGRPRLFSASDRDTRILLGDYLYAHGLVRVAEHGDTGVVGDLAELISLCAQLRAEAPEGPVEDGVAWAATLALLGNGNGELTYAREALRERGDPRPLAGLVERAAGPEAVARAGELHAARTSVAAV